MKVAEIYGTKYYSSAEVMLFNEKEMNIVSINTAIGLQAEQSI